MVVQCSVTAVSGVSVIYSCSSQGHIKDILCTKIPGPNSVPVPNFVLRCFSAGR